MNRFDYLSVAQGPVVDGLEGHEKVYAAGQAEYVTIRTLPGEEGKSAIYRLELNDAQRAIIADGGDILVEILHYGGNLAPSRVMVLNQRDLAEGEKKNLLRWFGAQTKGPYRGQGVRDDDGG